MASSSTRVCRFWLEGRCNRGDACRFRHDNAAIHAGNNDDYSDPYCDACGQYGHDNHNCKPTCLNCLKVHNHSPKVCDWCYICQKRGHRTSQHRPPKPGVEIAKAIFDQTTEQLMEVQNDRRREYIIKLEQYKSNMSSYEPKIPPEANIARHNAIIRERKQQQLEKELAYRKRQAEKEERQKEDTERKKRLQLVAIRQKKDLKIRRQYASAYGEAAAKHAFPHVTDPVVKKTEEKEAYEARRAKRSARASSSHYTSVKGTRGIYGTSSFTTWTTQNGNKRSSYWELGANEIN